MHKGFEPGTKTHAERLADVDRMLNPQEVTAVRVHAAYDPRGAFNIDIDSWRLIRDLAGRFGLAVPQDRINWVSMEAARFAGALRASLPETKGWPAEARKDLRRLLGLLGQGRGVSVYAVQGGAG